MLLQWTFILTLAVVMLSQVAAHAQDSHGLDSWATLSALAHLSEDDRQALHRGRTLVKLLDVADPSHLVVFAASHIDVTPQRFAERTRNSPRLWVGPSVPRTGTFANPVRAADVADMTLGLDDLRALPRCRRGDCDVKLSSSEMARIQAAIKSTRQWEPAAQREFREIVLDRISRYRRGGLSALEPFDDHDLPVAPAAAFSRLLSHAQGMKQLAPELVEYLNEYPRLPLPRDSEEFQYWLEMVHPPKPTMQAWHVTIRRHHGNGIADVIVISRQIFATHYVNGALAMTALVADDRGHPCMVYLNRVSADGLTGFLSGFKRFFIERRVRSGARAAFDWMRQRIEAPPSDARGGGGEL
jgi:hypothetical protein